MPWFSPRLAFYVFAVWGALAINFLLPRLMPGSPLGGLLQHLTPSQLSANPGIVQTYEALLGGGHHSIWADYVTYLHRISHFNFGISTSNYPTPVSEVVGRTLPYSMFLVGVAFLLAFVLGTGVGMLAAWRRGGVADSVFVPTFMVLSAFPAFFTALLGLYFFGLKLHWFPIQHAYDSGIVPGFNWTFLGSALRHAELPILVVVCAYAGGYAILPPLNGFAALFASAVGGLVFVEFIFSYPGAGYTLQQAVLGNDYALAQAILVVLSVCVILANLLMDLLTPVLDPRLRTG